MTPPPGNSARAEPGDLLGRLSVAEVQIRHLDETDKRIEGEVTELRKFKHAYGNILNGWKDFEAGVEAMQKSVSALQEQVAQLRTFDERLMGPGGAIEQLNSLAEDRRFKRRMYGWAAWLSGAIVAAFALLQAAAPYLKWPTPK